MTRLRVDGIFDWESVAEEFPGMLTFRGGDGGDRGVTEIEGDVHHLDLRLSIESHAVGTLDWLDAPGILGARPAPRSPAPAVKNPPAWRRLVALVAPGIAALAIEIARVIR